MLHFVPGFGVFAVAGLIAAAAPVVIHLLNRRRFRVVAWAAMDFLREAVHRERRLVQFRDVLLLLLRTACLLLFGLALARPFYSSAPSAGKPNEPLHAVLVVDNSLSMGYERLDGSLLEEAKAKAKEFLGGLPEGSYISVLPLCGSTAGFSTDAYRTKQDAVDALERIEVVDRMGSAATAVDLALQACRRVPDMPTKRIVFLGDQQKVNWPTGALGSRLEDLAELQVAAIQAEEIDNTWIADFRVQDGVADLQSPAVFAAVVHHEGKQPRNNVPVTLSIDGAEVESKVINLEPGQSREVTFQHRFFDVPAEPGKPVFVPARVSLPPDRLKEDDTRWLSVPVVAALAVVFVDQYGAEEEDSRKNRYGETRHLRRLLAPVVSRTESARQLVQVRHVKVEQVDRKLLEDARLVVVAGVADPGPAVQVLREYVEQGGQLVVAAGGEFDPAAWNQTAWLKGAGILPAPLRPQPVGALPDESPDVKPFFLAFNTMSHDLFHLADMPREELEDLYSLPCFFKAVAADLSETTMQEMVDAEAARIRQQRDRLAELELNLKQWDEKEAKNKLTDEQRRERDEQTQRRDSLYPTWLLWSPPQTELRSQVDPAEQAERTRSRPLAAFENRLPFLVHRRIGAGQVVFAASGVFSPWNNLPKTNAVLLFDRLFRSMLEGTLPQRNFESVEHVTLPVTDRSWTYRLKRPGGNDEPLTIDALGGDLYGVTVRGLASRGIYRVTASAGEEGRIAGAAGRERLWEAVLAVNGPVRESETAVVDQQELKARLGDTPFRWIARDEPISLEGARVRGQNLWKWLIGLVLIGLVAELALVARPALVRERTP